MFTRVMAASCWMIIMGSLSAILLGETVDFTTDELAELKSLTLKAEFENFLKNDWSKILWKKRIEKITPVTLGGLIGGGLLIHYGIRGQFPWQKKAGSAKRWNSAGPCQKVLQIIFNRRIFSGVLGGGLVAATYRYRLSEPDEDPEEVWWRFTYLSDTERPSSEFQNREKQILNLHRRVLQRLAPGKQIHLSSRMPHILFEGLPEVSRLDSGERLQVHSERNREGEIERISWTLKIL